MGLTIPLFALALFLCAVQFHFHEMMHIDAASVAAQEHRSSRTHQAWRRQQALDSSTDIPCRHAITTMPITNPSSTISGYGILFTMISSPYSSQSSNKEKIMVISSLGFHLNIDELNSVNGNANYEVYHLQGHYADHERTNEGNGGLPLDSTWDYRGNLTYWEKIAEGAVAVDDLVIWPTPYEDGVGNATDIEAGYFHIPYDQFKPISIPHSNSEGEGVQSFYITLREVGALLFAPMEGWQDLHDEQNVMYCGATRTSKDASADITNIMATGCVVDGDTINEKPIIQIGEGVVSYPFSSVPYFYQPRQFMGTIYYLNECPTASPSAMPSVTASPSFSLAPSQAPTIVETVNPSHSLMPTPSPSISPPPTALYYINLDQYGCHGGIKTDRQYESFKNQTSASYGVVFPLRSNEIDGDGVWITNLGFHVNFSSIPSLLDDDNKDTVNYEVYALIEEGIYADPNRTYAANAPETFDYRGDFSLWNKISTGQISSSDLVVDDYFQIPWENFDPTFIEPYGGVRSFYLTLDSGALVYQDLERKQNLGGTQQDDDFKSNKVDDNHPPILLYGEGVVGYPFHSTPFLYSPKQFIGKVFYEYECPSQAPSLAPSLDPSETPSLLPSNSPSHEPSGKPSLSPSMMPSLLPRCVDLLKSLLTHNAI